MKKVNGSKKGKSGKRKRRADSKMMGKSETKETYEQKEKKQLQQEKNGTR